MNSRLNAMKQLIAELAKNELEPKLSASDLRKLNRHRKTLAKSSAMMLSKEVLGGR